MPERSSTPRILSVDEANTRLPEVRKLLAALRTQRVTLQALEQAVAVTELEGLRPDGTPSPEAQTAASPKARELTALVEEFHGTLRHMDALGCQLKDLDRGLVDFFTVHQGQLVSLCWKDGEAAIRFWHSLEDGYAGRRPITELANN